MNWLFYTLDCPRKVMPQPLNRRFNCDVWKPGCRQVRPIDLPLWPFGIWWAFHELRIFSNKEYSIVIIHRNTALVHRSCIFPRYFRFSFMAQEDLQIGDIWTAPGYRGLGLATYGLSRAVQVSAIRPRRLWYIVEETNTASIRVAEKLGFACAARGKRTSRLGLQLLGSFSFEPISPFCGTSHTQDEHSAITSP